MRFYWAEIISDFLFVPPHEIGCPESPTRDKYGLAPTDETLDLGTRQRRNVLPPDLPQANSRSGKDWQPFIYAIGYFENLGSNPRFPNERWQPGNGIQPTLFSGGRVLAKEISPGGFKQVRIRMKS